MMLQDQPKPYIVPPCDKDIEVLYADDDILLINKPAGLLSVPGRHPLNHDSVASRLQQQYPEMGMAHRLDLDTSGIMVIPLHKQALSVMNRRFQERQVHKTYTAIVYGQVQADSGKIDLPLIFDWPNRPMQKVCQSSGKGALTLYQVLERNPQQNTSRLLFTPITGRSHQLRIHSRELGHPILGCDMYATREIYEMAERLMLHATEIRFKHPLSNREIQAVCEPDFL